MTNRTAGFGSALSALVLVSGCLVTIEPEASSEPTSAISTAEAGPSVSYDGWGSAGGMGGTSGAGNPSAGGTSGTENPDTGVAGAPPDAGADPTKNDPGDGGSDGGGLCAITMEHALAYFEAKQQGVQSSCTAVSCAAGECCYNLKLCIAE
jgi:hypothetical protein